MAGLGLERLAGRRVGVLGLARSGIAAGRALARAGAEVLAFDDRPQAAAGFAAGTREDIPGLALLVVSPGVPLTHPAPHAVIVAARAAGVPVTGDIELFATSLAGPRPILAITGTNGKSTTTALVHHLLHAAGRPAQMGGNIGRAVFDLAPGPADEALVLELSSYQLDLCETLRCRVAAWLNLTPDHLDRHGGMEGYAAAKRRIFRNQQPGDTAVVAIDDAPSRALADELAAAGRRVLRVSSLGPVRAGVGVEEGILLDGLDGPPVAVADLRGLATLRGRHNQQNVAAAYAMLRAFKLAPEEAVRGLESFAGLPHRTEEVGRIGPVLFVNDSKATNPESATKSLASFSDIFWIAGGVAKEGGFATLLPHLGAVRRAYLIGVAAPAMAAALGGRVPLVEVGTLEEAVAMAHADAQASGLAEPVVLLAPACASFDQFTSFEARGDAFRALVAARMTGER
ncbi:UDP-N-acetylmuramoyl-L-alanine--D-glutamate ligase [Marinimicrococcus flavescens]|uniref:UDP-N-acetylmuramoylalanine--D-glutamate ligase n=1 Tax=Marinimicrococcus flavescens TaxID=3031815 RepID=A0AAP3XT98_9PROT|nr:UDP-N-acetylmuramoyl-L-alanine--D-glutamate ligase [Marinimicrococcus flavescens]